MLHSTLSQIPISLGASMGAMLKKRLYSHSVHQNRLDS